MSEKAILVGVNVNNQKYFEESMKELKNLSDACNIETAGVITQSLNEKNRVFYVGSGKVGEIKELCEKEGVEIVIFNNELSPSQTRNLERELDCLVMDRTGLILEIFATRAKTREAKLQVEVARLKYILPRLTGSYAKLGRQGGGVGTKNKGTGEKKLELDKRKIEEKITNLSKELEELVNERKTQRSKRSKKNIPTVALVGYTNAGKSTIMNAMVENYKKSEDKKVFEEDMLFATLETSVRNITLPNHKEFILADTVGFVSELPHNLIKAFRSTLEEVREADLLCHVVDFSNDNFEQHIEVTNETLRQIGAEQIPMVYIFNKSDLVDKEIPFVREDKIYLSAKQRVGITELVDIIVSHTMTDYVKCKMLIPYNQGSILSYFNEHANVETTSYEENGTVIELECRDSDFSKYKYLVLN